MSGFPTLEQWQELFRNASPCPWRHETSKEMGGEFSGEDWLLASLGNGWDDRNHFVCTDHIHCSEMVSGGAGEDAELMVALRNNGPEALRRMYTAEREVERLRAEVDTATNHVRALVAAMAEWGSWEDGVPAPIGVCGGPGRAYDAAKAFLASKGAEHE